MCSTCGGAVCKLHVMANITPRKTAEQAHKNSVSFQSEIPKLPLKSHYKLIGKKQINTVCIFNSISLNGLPGYWWDLKAPVARERVNVLNVLHMEEINRSTDRCNAQCSVPKACKSKWGNQSLNISWSCTDASLLEETNKSTLRYVNLLHYKCCKPPTCWSPFVAIFREVLHEGYITKTSEPMHIHKMLSFIYIYIYGALLFWHIILVMFCKYCVRQKGATIKHFTL